MSDEAQDLDLIGEFDAQKCADRPAGDGELIPPLPVFVFQGKTK